MKFELNVRLHIPDPPELLGDVTSGIEGSVNEVQSAIAGFMDHLKAGCTVPPLPCAAKGTITRLIQSDGDIS